jgi:hypothetical protein
MIRPVCLLACLSATCIALPAFAQDIDLEPVPLGQGWVFDAYGRLNLAYQSFNDGAQTTSNIVDMSTSTGRIGFFIERPDADQGLAFQFETGLGISPSKSFSQTSSPPFWEFDRTLLRQVQVIWYGGWGKLRVGQGSMASDSIAEIDLGDTTVVAKSNIDEMGGSYLFRLASGPLSDVDIGSSFDSFDGDRRFRLRYDTPAAAGFSLAMSYGIEVLKSSDDNAYYDLAVRYSHSFGGLDVKAGIGNSYVNIAGSGLDYVTAGSVSLFDNTTGLNLTLASGRDHRGSEASYIWAKASWTTELIASGVTRFYVEAHQGEDFITTGSDSSFWGLGVMQRIDRHNLDLFAGYRVFSFSDLSGATYQDADVIQIGAHITF